MCVPTNPTVETYEVDYECMLTRRVPQFHFLRSVGYTYMTQRTLDEKDHDASRWCKGSFEGYKSRTEAE